MLSGSSGLMWDRLVLWLVLFRQPLWLPYEGVSSLYNSCVCREAPIWLRVRA